MLTCPFSTVLFVISHLLFHYTQGACFHCLAPDAHLAPTIRTQLKTQNDVFFWQIGTQWNACSERVNPSNPSIEGQLCSRYPLCVTLQPNIHNSTFVVRGCLENVLRHNWREDPRIHEEGCFMVRSQPLYPNIDPMDFIICVCKGDYCNGEPPVAFVPGPYYYHEDTVLKLSQKDDYLYVPGERAQWEVSSLSPSLLSLSLALSLTVTLILL